MDGVFVMALLEPWVGGLNLGETSGDNRIVLGQVEGLSGGQCSAYIKVNIGVKVYMV